MSQFCSDSLAYASVRKNDRIFPGYWCSFVFYFERKPDARKIRTKKRSLFSLLRLVVALNAADKPPKGATRRPDVFVRPGKFLLTVEIRGLIIPNGVAKSARQAPPARRNWLKTVKIRTSLKEIR